MERHLDDKEKNLLRILQEDFSLSQRPFLDIAEKLHWSEDEVITRIKNLIELGFIRKFGAIIDPKKIGYISILCAIDVIEEKIEETAALINQYPGVTHNYLREGHPNIWFTITKPDKQTIEKDLTEIEKRVGVKIMRMPATHIFKIGVKLAI